jgi:hypothetical protein
MQEIQLLPFLEEHVAQDVTLLISDIDKFCADEAWQGLNTYYSKFKNLSLCFYPAQSFKIIPAPLADALPHLEMPFYFGFYVSNFDQLHYVLNLGAKQVYLVEDICFDLERAKRLCVRHEAKIRAIPNVAQASVATTPTIKKFFIRPEDVKEYADVIDTLEFWGPADRQEILLRIYKSGKWFGDLKALMLDFDIEFDSRTIMPGFAQIRKTCERKCMKGEHCHICDKVYDISGKMKENHIILTPKKND